VPIHLQDRQLVKRLRKGDERAFTAFFNDYFPRLYRFAQTNMQADRDAIREVVQGALIKAVRGMGNYRGEAALFTWLCAICRNEIADWQRRNARYRENILLVEDHPEIRAAIDSIALPESADPQQAQQRRELTRLVQVALDHLPPRYGDALEWKYIEGRSVKEIANRLAISSDAAQSLLARARRAFEEVYGSLVRPMLEPGTHTIQAQ